MKTKRIVEGFIGCSFLLLLINIALEVNRLHTDTCPSGCENKPCVMIVPDSKYNMDNVQKSNCLCFIQVDNVPPLTVCKAFSLDYDSLPSRFTSFMWCLTVPSFVVALFIMMCMGPGNRYDGYSRLDPCFDWIDNYFEERSAATKKNDDCIVAIIV